MPVAPDAAVIENAAVLAWSAVLPAVSESWSASVAPSRLFSCSSTARLPRYMSCRQNCTIHVSQWVSSILN